MGCPSQDIPYTRSRPARWSSVFLTNATRRGRRLAFFPPQPPTYVVKHHPDGQREAYIQPTIPCDPHHFETSLSAEPVLRLLFSKTCCKRIMRSSVYCMMSLQLRVP